VRISHVGMLEITPSSISKESLLLRNATDPALPFRFMILNFIVKHFPAPCEAIFGLQPPG
jgi:hypothetical protein